MTRLRSAAQRAPQSLEQATPLAARYALSAARVAELQACLASRIAAVEAEIAAEILPLVAEMKDLHKRLKPWWEGNHEALTGGKRKSIELAGTMLGFRLGNPTVKFTGTDEAAIAALDEAQLADLVRDGKRSLDKPAILKALDGEDAEALVTLGFTSEQKEAFFIDLATPTPIAEQLAGDVAPAEDPR